MLEDFGDDDTIKLAQWKIVQLPVIKPDSMCQPLAAQDRWLMRINCCHLVSAICQRNCKLRSIPASNIQHSQFAPVPPGKLSLHGGVDKTKTLPVSPQVLREVWWSCIPY